MPLHCVTGDICTRQTDAVVNAANSRLLPGSGVCGALHRAAGFDRLAEACRAIGGCETGHAVATPGFNLPARYIIHAVGPVWNTPDCERLLADCYTSALELALALGCRSIAFPLISAGNYGCPAGTARRVAEQAILGFLAAHNDRPDVWLVLYGEQSGTSAAGEQAGPSAGAGHV